MGGPVQLFKRPTKCKRGKCIVCAHFHWVQYIRLLNLAELTRILTTWQDHCTHKFQVTQQSLQGPRGQSACGVTWPSLGSIGYLSWDTPGHWSKPIWSEQQLSEIPRNSTPTFPNFGQAKLGRQVRVCWELLRGSLVRRITRLASCVSSFTHICSYLSRFFSIFCCVSWLLLPRILSG